MAFKVQGQLLGIIAICFLLFAIDVNANETARIIHVFVALCDNEHQGIVPVSAQLGNGSDPKNNLYWGAMYGVKTFFQQSENWRTIQCGQHIYPVLERCVFKHRREEVYMVADAYDGREIEATISDFLKAVAGQDIGQSTVKTDDISAITVKGGVGAELLVYIGHNGLMDFSMNSTGKNVDNSDRQTIILACKSRQYFEPFIREAGAIPLIWTTGFMAPEAYTLESALEGWVFKEDSLAIAERAARAYAKYQKCPLGAARKLLPSGQKASINPWW